MIASALAGANVAAAAGKSVAAAAVGLAVDMLVC